MLARSGMSTVAAVVFVGLASMALMGGPVDEAQAQSAASKLSQLTVRSEDYTVPYNRDDYGYPDDALENGWTLPPTVPQPEECESDQAALIRDGRGERVTTDDCAILGGRRIDPYTGQTLGLGGLQVDHLVPLAEAHYSGASRFPATRKVRFGNAPEELLSVKASENLSKSASDPAEYKPPRRAYHCTYATKWINVKSKWKLSVDEAERSALREMLGVGRCPQDGGGASSPGARQTPPARGGEQEDRPAARERRDDRRDVVRPRNLPRQLPDTGGSVLLPAVLLLGFGIAGIAVLRR